MGEWEQRQYKCTVEEDADVFSISILLLAWTDMEAVSRSTHTFSCPEQHLKVAYPCYLHQVFWHWQSQYSYTGAILEIRIRTISSFQILLMMKQLLTRRFDLMKKLSRPREELDNFLARYTNYSDIRRLRVRQALDDGKTDEAIRLLEEGKSVDLDKRGLVAEYSEGLMDLYERQGQRDKLLTELEYHVFTLSSGGMEMLNRLKKVCTPVQWMEYRERYLSGQKIHKLELMESEGLWERLMEAVTEAGYLPVLDRYEDALKKRYPDEMLEAYARILMKKAAAVSNRKQYQELAHYLNKIKSYPGGTERAAQLAEDWRTRYSRRRAMMEELEKAGF